MKKSEMIQKLIEIEGEKKSDTKITLSYVQYLEGLKKAIEIGDIEVN